MISERRNFEKIVFFSQVFHSLKGVDACATLKSCVPVLTNDGFCPVWDGFWKTNRSDVDGRNVNSDSCLRKRFLIFVLQSFDGPFQAW